MLSRRILRIKAIKALYAHLKSEADSMVASEKSMIEAIDKAYDLYFQMLILPVELVQYAQGRIDVAKQKRVPTYVDLNPNTKFVDNRVISVIANSDLVNDYASKRGLGWHAANEDFIRLLYTALTESEFYKVYMAIPEPTFKDDVAFIEAMYKSWQDCEDLDNELEDMSIMWSDDLCYIISIVLRTLTSLRPSHTELKILPKFKNDDDLYFVKTLFEKSLLNYGENIKFVEKFTKNWDLERIVFMDNLIICAAMTELMAFEDIPIKVTMDEYIDISKYYSTPGSSTFVNGVLDKITEELKADGRIAKHGRGVM